MAQYVMLHRLGFLTDEDLQNYCVAGGQLGAHPDWGVPGIGASTGSLGHGLGMSVGSAYAQQLENKGACTYVLISDGELQEGSTWEAIMMGSNLKLSNLTLFIDLNDRISMAKLSQEHSSLFPLAPKFESFGWMVQEVDGHDSAAISTSILKASEEQTCPQVIICNTVKGKGISFMEDIPIWHYRSPNEDEYRLALAELEAKREETML